MTLEEYQRELDKLKSNLKHIGLDEYREKYREMFQWVLSNGVKLIGDETNDIHQPLGNVSYTKNNQYLDVAKQSSIKRKSNALSDLERAFEHDLDLLIDQVEGMIDESV